MNRFDFYFEQLVTQADMDEAFDFAEDADQQIMSDNGYVGIVQGQDVAEHFPTPDLTVDIAVGAAYDQTGQRIYIDTAQTLDCSIDSNSVATTVSSGGNEKWLSIFVGFDRALSDPRIDGNGAPLQYRRAESFQFIVDQGAEAAAGSPAVYTAGNAETYTLANGQTLEVVVDNTPAQTVTFLTADFSNIAAATAAEVAAVLTAQLVGVTGSDVGGNATMTTAMTGPSASVRVVGGTAASQFAWPTSAAVGSGGPTRPALRSDSLLLADVLLRFGTTQIFDAPDPGGASGVVDAVTRRQTVFVFNGASFTIKEGTITEFATAVAQEISNHINEVGSSHPASAIDYDPTILPVPALWSATAAAGEVQAALDGIVDDLAQTTAPMGSAIVGHNIVATWQDAIAVTQATDSVYDAIEGIITDLADDFGTSGASRIGFDGSLSTGPDLSALGSGIDIRDALFELDAEKGSLTNANTWTAQNTMTGELQTDGLLDVNGNINIGSATMTKVDPSHGLASWDLTWHEDSLQDTGSATDTVDMLLYSDTQARAGIIEGVAYVYTDNLNDSFVAVRFVIPFSKLASSTVQIDNNNNFFVEVGGSGTVTLQGASPTSASLSVVAGTNTLSLRLTHNAGPTTRNLVAMWRLLEGPLDS